MSAEQHTQARTDFDARAASDTETLEQIRATYAQDGYILDPHTAFGVRAAGERPDTVCLATAHPAKFNEIVEPLVGGAVQVPAALEELLELPSSFEEITPDLDALKSVLEDTADT